MWEKLPIVVHCTDFKNPEDLMKTLRENLFHGLEPNDQIRLARDMYTDTSRYLACTNGPVAGECPHCQKIIEAQRKVAQEILRDTAFNA